VQALVLGSRPLLLQYGTHARSHARWGVAYIPPTRPTLLMSDERIYSGERLHVAAAFHRLRGRVDFEGVSDMEVAFRYFKDHFSAKNTDRSMNTILSHIDDEAGKYAFRL
jgi:hypothetical protein